MPWVGFEPTISAVERPKTYALDRAATGTGLKVIRKGNLQFSYRYSPLRRLVAYLTQTRERAGYRTGQSSVHSAVDVGRTRNQLARKL